MSRTLRTISALLIANVLLLSISLAQPVMTGTRLTGPHGGYCPAFAMTEDGTILAPGPSQRRGHAAPSMMYARANDPKNWLDWTGVPDTAQLCCIEPVSPTRVLAGMTDGLYLSEAAAPGADWQRIGFVGKRITALAKLRDGNIYLCTINGEIHRSADNGATWSFHSMMGGYTPGDRFALNFAMDERHRLFAQDYSRKTWRQDSGRWSGVSGGSVLPVDNGIILGAGYKGISRSDDDGANWELRMPEDSILIEYASFAASSSGSIYVSVTGVLNNYVGKIFKSMDAGVTWTKIYTGAVTGVCMGPHGELLAANFGAGIVRIDTADGSSEYLGPPTARVRNIAVNRSSSIDDHIFVTLDTIADWTAGLVRSTDAGESWEWVPLTYRKQTHVVSDGTISVASWSADAQRLHLSRDNGATWARFEMPAPCVALVLDPLGAIYVAGNNAEGRVHSSTDDGASWTSSVVESGQAVTGLALSGGKLYAGTSTGVFRSTDAGSTWIRMLTLPVSGALVTGLAASDFVSVLDKPNIRLTYTSPSGSGMLVSADDGDTWTPLTLPGNIGALFAPGLDRDVYTVITAATFDHVDGPGDDPRMLLSHDGQSWKEVGPSPTCVSATTGTWYYGTRGFAVYHMQTPNGIGGTQAAAQGISLGQNYPNPFNPSTRLPFAVEKPMRVTLVVTDVLGREVARPVDGELREAGNHVIDFDASDLPGGVYFCRIEAGGVVLHRAMTLLR